MKVFFVADGKRTRIHTTPDVEAVDVDLPCPGCGAKPFRTHGNGRRIADDDRAYEADAVCCSCRKVVGVLRVEVNTLFGLREDEAVGRMGIRIY